MARAPFQVLVLPYRYTARGHLEYAILRRVPRDGGYWQGVAGGGEGPETPIQAARRETHEETGISPDSTFLPLDSIAAIPVQAIPGLLCAGETRLVPEHSFGVDARGQEIVLSPEHTEARWVDYDTAQALLKWDSNKNALRELNTRLSPGAAPTA